MMATFGSSLSVSPGSIVSLRIFFDLNTLSIGVIALEHVLVGSLTLDTLF